jgi:predicted membrane channel-forming protein YqfA (hemolysin III family)
VAESKQESKQQPTCGIIHAWNVDKKMNWMNCLVYVVLVYVGLANAAEILKWMLGLGSQPVLVQHSYDESD